MATTYYNDIAKLYVAYFNRPADPAGLAYWEGRVEAANGSTAAVSAEFAGSAEYKATYAGMTNEQIVDKIYQNLFGRPAEDAGKKYWADLMTAGTITIDAAVRDISNAALGSDKTAFNNKVTAGLAFTAALDTDAEKAGYNADSVAAAKTWLSTITDDTSLVAATTPTALNTTVAGVVAKGTPFTVTGTLASLDVAQTALNDFVTGLDKDVNGDGKVDDADVGAAYDKALAKVAGELTGGATGASGTLFTADTTTSTVRDALIAAQQATNAGKLSTDQATLAADNTAIAKVSGLSVAATTLTAAKSALTTAQTAQTAADADLAAKQASFEVTNKGTLSVAAGELILTPKDGSAAVTLGDVSSTGKVTINADITASDYAGLTDLISSYNTDAAAVANVTKADLNLSNAQLSVNLLDVALDTAGNVTVTDENGVSAAFVDANGKSYTESALIKAIADQINTTTKDTVAAGATPTLSQIQTELAVLKAGTDTAAYNNFKALVDAETNADAKFNPLVAKQTADAKVVSDDTKAISTFAKDVAALHTAEANVSTLEGLQATVDATKQLLLDNHYHVVTLNTDAGTEFATADSDVYIVNGHNESIAAFGLQGSDALFVGTGYTLVQGAIGDTGVKGSTSALEIFVSTNATGDAQLQIETNAYSSNVATAAGEIVTITLTGVDASTLHLGADGIITAGGTTV